MSRPGRFAISAGSVEADELSTIADGLNQATDTLDDVQEMPGDLKKALLKRHVDDIPGNISPILGGTIE